MDGYADGPFGAGGRLSRAMLSQILYNKEGKPSLTSSSFPDVSAGAWYTGAVLWAVENGIINGSSSGLNPGGFATRGEVAQMLSKYLGK